MEFARAPKRARAGAETSGGGCSVQGESGSKGPIMSWLIERVKG